jgi:hypothetical protein
VAYDRIPNEDDLQEYFEVLKKGVEKSVKTQQEQSEVERLQIPQYFNDKILPTQSRFSSATAHIIRCKTLFYYRKNML